MRLRLRLLLLILFSLWRSPSKNLLESVLTLRVLPNDTDVSKMTYDRYLAVMDLGRADLMLRYGMLKTLFRKKWIPYATFASIRFRHSLAAFSRYLLKSSIIYWDEERFYLRYNFERRGRPVATGYLFVVFTGPDGKVRPDEVLQAIGASVQKPEKTEIIARLHALEEVIHREQRDMDPVS